MCSIRNLSLAAIGLAGILLVGCEPGHPGASTRFLSALGDQYPPQQKPDLVNADPIPDDPAMDARQWPQSQALYPNFSTTAGDAQVALVPRSDLPPAVHAAIENALFPFDTLFIPDSMLFHPPYQQVEATSLYLPPTYTGNPPLDPQRPNDFSGGPGTGYIAAPGRAVDSTKAVLSDEC
jgi:hypothetical protein